MTELRPFAHSPRPGFRLHKLEAFNWGTFDSAHGAVYTIRPRGQNALLVGQNGSGKSTLVDALLTLLVRPVVRNYNVAAGGRKLERDERTYIKGAYGRTSRDEDNRGEIDYLRPDGKHYSALLATFVNEDSGKAFSVAQLLYLAADGRVEKIYCLAPGEKSLASDCSGFVSLERLPKQLEERGWRAAKSYKEFHQWFTKATGVKPKAMDMLNQTVAVKDIQSLSDFIRKHMLEAKPWNERVESVLGHFTLLSEAHQSLVRIRRQAELLEPIARRAKRYRELADRLGKTQRLLDAGDAYFDQQSVQLFLPYAEAVEAQGQEASKVKDRLSREIDAAHEEERSLRNEIEAAGGDRLRQLPMLIDQRQLCARTAREAHERYVRQIELGGLGPTPGNEVEFVRLRAGLAKSLDELASEGAALQQQRDDLVLERGDASRSLQCDLQEWESLRQRTGNLPRSLAELRSEICTALQIAEQDLPFAAELIRVDVRHRDWEASIEMALRSFALSLLVSEKHYRRVSAYVERTRLRDCQGEGQRLVYLRVGKCSDASIAPAAPNSLLSKLELRETHALLPWLRGELADRFDYQCCRSIDEFNEVHGPALTAQRHFRQGRIRHEKDDRRRSVDPRRFVLGWDNRQKLRQWEEEIERQQTVLQEFDVRVAELDRLMAAHATRRVALAQLQSFADYGEIDFRRHERDAAALLREKAELEQNNDAVRTLRARFVEVERHRLRLGAERDETIGLQRDLAAQAAQARRLVVSAQRALDLCKLEPTWSARQLAFGEIADALAARPLGVDDFHERRRQFLMEQNAEAKKVRQRIEPLKDKLCGAMNQFLRVFGDLRSDLDARIEYLESFVQLYEQIQRDDLPRHEQRFKDRLNEKATQEIGLLNGALQTERTEIESKIDLLNVSLRQVEYRPGSHMKLEAKLVRDREINEFRKAIAECLSGAFDGTLEADEARYCEIEKLVHRLREEERWRDKVTDVRNWFDFAAVEIDDHTGAQRAYYEDSAGQSGGEKAKLAFTILVAAIAYQYDIDPQRPRSDRFHFVVVDEMFSKVDDSYAAYALDLFRKFGLQLLIVAPLDAKARVTEPYVGYYAHVVKDAKTHRSAVLSMTAAEFAEAAAVVPVAPQGARPIARRSPTLPRQPR